MAPHGNVGPERHEVFGDEVVVVDLVDGVFDVVAAGPVPGNPEVVAHVLGHELITDKVRDEVGREVNVVAPR
jgi:hypothetical protein